MTRFWRALGRSWPLAAPRPRLRALVGEDELVSIERARLVRAEPLNPGDAYPCLCHAEPGCKMRLVDEDGLVAVCGLARAQCAEEVLPDEDAVRLHADLGSVVPLLQRGLRVPSVPPVVRQGVVLLGERSVGGVGARFALAPRPSGWVADGGLERVVDEDPDRVLVVLVFDRQQVPAGAPRRIRGTRVEWVALSEAFDAASGVVDLAAMWLAIAPGADLGPELWPRYVFTADPDRGKYTYAGRPLPLDRRLQEARLLIELLKGGGEWVARSYLLGSLWPDASKTKPRPTPDQMDRRLRQLKSALSSAFEELPAMRGVPVDPIENLRSGDDAAGGYRIAVPRERVLWLSRPV